MMPSNMPPRLLYRGKVDTSFASVFAAISNFHFSFAPKDSDADLERRRYQAKIQAQAKKELEQERKVPASFCPNALMNELS